ncbi:hypothetical protein ES703_102956 [subsurface metagenome]
MAISIDRSSPLLSRRHLPSMTNDNRFFSTPNLKRSWLSRYRPVSAPENKPARIMKNTIANINTVLLTIGSQ